jgi:hypothetical protein
VAAECPVRSAGLADLGKLCERIDGTLRLAGANGSLDELRQRPDRQPQTVRVRHRPLGGGQRVVVATEPVVADCAAPVMALQPQPFAALQHVLAAGLGERLGFGIPPAPVGQRERGARGQVTAGGRDDGLSLGGQ